MSAVQHGFKAEVQQLLDLMIHSVYSDREVFLRELVSNAADALDKARFHALTQELLPSVGDEPGIRIEADAEANTITIDDDGVGMTEEEAIGNLGTIAHSGTRAFLSQIEEGVSAPELIGQFGIGFYSCFMVASKVEVDTRAATPGSPAVRWVSEGAGTYEVAEGSRETRGTRIVLHLRDDATEFADKTRLANIVRKHSNFLAWPIHIDGEQANSGRALWSETPSAVDEEEANTFYKSITMDWRDPALKIHVQVDSPIQYSALLFIPSERPYDLFNLEADKGPRLYAKRVLITEHADDMLPEWLRFVRGVVDSEDIPLNVSREMVQKTRVVRKIRDALTKRILKALGELADANTLDEADRQAAQERYASVWNNFGLLLKEGYYRADEDLRKLILPLIRVQTVQHDADDLVSLERVKADMGEGQDAIWYLTAESRAAALQSPHLEAFRKRGWDVVLLTDPVDEWLVQILSELDGTALKSVARGDLDLGEEDDEEKADLTGLTPFLEELYAGAVSAVRTSSRLTDSACVLVDDESGIPSNMERILRQANQMVPPSRRVLELNPKHALIRNLAALHTAGKTDVVEPIAELLLDDARLVDGSLAEPAAMGKRLESLLAGVAARAAAEA